MIVDCDAIIYYKQNGWWKAISVNVFFLFMHTNDFLRDYHKMLEKIYSSLSLQKM